jgi:hypothetical protein
MPLYPKETEMSDYLNFKRLKLEDAGVLPPIVDEDFEFINRIKIFRKKFPPEFLLGEFSQMVSEMVEKSEGKFKSFKFYPDFIGSDEKNERNGTYKMGIGDKPIFLMGFEIGFIERTVQWLHPSAWCGQGVPLRNQML